MSDDKKTGPDSGLEPEQRAGLESMLGDYDAAGAVADKPGEPAGEPAGMSSAELCAVLLSVGFGFLASRRGEHWALSPDESEQLGSATGAVLDKYVPDLESGPEWALVGVSMMVILPRVMLDRQAMEKQQQQQGEKNGSESSPGAAE